MIVARICESIDADWTRLDPVRVGGVPAGQGTPDRFVTVSEGSIPLLRMDVYSYGSDCFAFQDAIFWHSHVVVGFGSHVHAVSLRDRSVVTLTLDSYFGQLYPTADYLLVASGERLLRVEPDRSVLWTSASLAIDGVVVAQPEPPIIRGEGEWDPPGGWEPFALFAADGQLVPKAGGPKRPGGPGS